MAYDEKIKKKVQILYEKGTTFKEISEQYKYLLRPLDNGLPSINGYVKKVQKKVLKQNERHQVFVLVNCKILMQ